MSPQTTPPQIDGKTDLDQQQIELQSLEAFFVEVIGYEAGEDTRNNVKVKDADGPPSSPLQLKAIAADSDVTDLSAGGDTVAFQGTVFVSGVKQKVVGFRAN